VPIDDRNTWVYNFTYSATHTASMTDEYWDLSERRFGRGPDDFIPGTHWLKANLTNDFFIDRDVQRTKTYTGIPGINTQDFAVQTGMGPIVDRSKEALGSTDRAIQTARKLLLEAVDDVAEDRPLRGSDPLRHSHLRAAEMIVPRGSDWEPLAKEALEACW